jgi:PAS domain S-box-containing protein
MRPDASEPGNAESWIPPTSTALKLVTLPRLLPPAWRYAIAVSAVGAATVFALWLRPHSYATPFLFFYPAVILAVWIGGLRPGLLATVLASLSANHYFLPPYAKFILDAQNLFRTIFFGLTFATTCWLAELARIQLRESKRQFRLLADSIPQLAWIANADGWVSWFNRRWYEYTGTTPDQMEGWGWQTVHDPAVLPAVLDRWRASIKSGEPFDMVFPLRGADGRFRPFLTRVMPVKDRERKVVQWFGTGTDISTQKQAEEALQRQLSITQTITSNAADALFMLDARGRVTFLNPAAEAIFGFKAEELLGTVLHDAIHHKRADGSPYPMSECPFGQVYGERITLRRHEDVFFRKDGAPVYVACSQAPLVEGDRVIASVLVVRDITERKQAEQALLRSEKLAATGRLAATIAHEINNPLEAMTNIVYLLSQSVTDAGARDYVDMLEKQLAGVNRITQQTLKFHRNYGQPAKFQLSELIEELLAFLESKAKEHGVTVVKRLETAGEVVGFSGEIRQVLSNLLLNAIEATPHDGRIAVHLYAGVDWRSRGRHGYRISVADTGTGIDSQHRLRIFEPFFSTKEDKGTGLGLWVSMGIVDRAGGSMRVWSTQRPGRSGTCFSVFLPTNLPRSEMPGRRRYEADEPAAGA